MPTVRMNTEKTLTLTVDKLIARISINRPTRRNALTEAMWETLFEWVNHLPEELRLLIITGEGGVFTSGSDIRELAKISMDRVDRIFRLIESTARTIEAMPVPSVAAISGPALGGGLILALACDLRIGTSRAQFGMPVGRLGITLQPPFLERLVQVLGLSRTKDLIYTGRTYQAREALNIGLLNYLVPDATRFAEEVEGLAGKILAQSPPSLVAVKENMERLLKLTTAEVTESWVGPDFAEGIRAFTEKRSPSFPGGTK
ncbi:MAG: enoyl-CoA hydratase-related protein [Firmicutes bacterium]|nr:enoyl-CoA hydratase-related protein [Bacillota bacterium]MCL5015323.1 enoyl-CoA hydratase-related protein [Bacillota bacterium]